MGRMRRRDVRPSSDSEIPMKKPAADFSARAFEDFCDDDAMPVICPTCQILFDAPRCTRVAYSLKRLNRRHILHCDEIDNSQLGRLFGGIGHEVAWGNFHFKKSVFA